jgi:hypothetical protein
MENDLKYVFRLLTHIVNTTPSPPKKGTPLTHMMQQDLFKVFLENILSGTYLNQYFGEKKSNITNPFDSLQHLLLSSIRLFTPKELIASCHFKLFLLWKSTTRWDLMMELKTSLPAKKNQ